MYVIVEPRTQYEGRRVAVYSAETGELVDEGLLEEIITSIVRSLGVNWVRAGLWEDFYGSEGIEEEGTFYNPPHTLEELRNNIVESMARGHEKNVEALEDQLFPSTTLSVEVTGEDEYGPVGRIVAPKTIIEFLDEITSSEARVDESVQQSLTQLDDDQIPSRVFKDTKEFLDFLGDPENSRVAVASFAGSVSEFRILLSDMFGYDDELAQGYLDVMTEEREFTEEEQEQIAGLLDRPENLEGSKPVDTAGLYDTDFPGYIPLKAFESNVAAMAGIPGYFDPPPSGSSTPAEHWDPVREALEKYPSLTDVEGITWGEDADYVFYDSGELLIEFDKDEYLVIRRSVDPYLVEVEGFEHTVKQAGVNWAEVAFHLWRILDNIDTFDDMAKTDSIVFRKLVKREQRRRWDWLSEEKLETLYDHFWKNPEDPS